MTVVDWGLRIAILTRGCQNMQSAQRETPFPLVCRSWDSQLHTLHLLTTGLCVCLADFLALFHRARLWETALREAFIYTSQLEVGTLHRANAGAGPCITCGAEEAVVFSLSCHLPTRVIILRRICRLLDIGRGKGHMIDIICIKILAAGSWDAM